MRGVPRPRRAISRAARLASGTSRIRAERSDDLRQLLLGVEVEPVGGPEPVAQRAADPARARRRADDRERLQREAQRSRRRPLADHHVQREVLHRRIEDLLDRPVEPVDLVDEEDVALVEGREDRREVARALHRRSARVADVHAELARDDRRERGLAEARRAVQEDVVGRLPSLPGSREQDREVVLDVLLADVLVEAARPERAFDDPLAVVEDVRRLDVRDVVGHSARVYRESRPISYGCSMSRGATRGDQRPREHAR